MIFFIQAEDYYIYNCDTDKYHETSLSEKYIYFSLREVPKSKRKHKARQDTRKIHEKKSDKSKDSEIKE